MTATMAIEIRDLNVSYERPEDHSPGTGTAARAAAVTGVSISVGRGEIHALLGAYGSGKTTVLEAAAGLRRPSTGRVLVHGADPYIHRDAVRVGGVWREGGLFPGLTVGEVVETWRRWSLDPLDRDEALTLAGLDGLEKVPFERLSALERRRLDLALALVGRSDVLFLDEPTAGLGRADRLEVWRTLRSLAGAGITVLVATRDLDVTRCADQISILKAGRIVSGAASHVAGRVSGLSAA